MRRAAPKKPKKTDRSPAQLGIFAVPDVNFDGSDGDDDDDDDAALEAELMMILSSDTPSRPKPPKPKAKPALGPNLDKMVAESLKDIPSDASLSGDDDDPDLLAELDAVTSGVPGPTPTKSQPLQPITNASLNAVSTIRERIDVYKTAEANAKAVGDSSKVRRLDRGLKTLQGLLKKAEAGGDVDESEIPPPVSVAVKKAPSPPPTAEPQDNPVPVFEPIDIDTAGVRELPPPPPPRPSMSKPAIEEQAPSQEVESTVSLLKERQEEYKKAALRAKKSGDNETALSHVKIVKGFESVIAAASSGQHIDLSTIPPSPGLEPKSPPSNKPPTPPPRSSPIVQPAPPAIIESPSQLESIPVPDDPKPPATVMEALEQRLAKFKEQEEAAKRDNNASKVRRMGRIVKQYQDAIKLHKAGKPIPVDELPTPPGFAPIPVDGVPAPSGLTPGPAVSPRPSPTPSPSPSKKIPDPAEPTSSPSQPKRPAPAVPSPGGGSVSNASIRHAGSKQGTRQGKQLTLLEAKQKQFKIAALKAKQSGDLNLAKEYLRQAKCFDSLIEASINGFPVDLSSLPPPPGSSLAVEKEYEIVKASDCLPNKPTSEIYTQLILDLQHQLKTCMETRAHYKAMGDVAHANQFEQLAVATKKDLDTVKIACNKDAPIPKFHYERRTYEIIQCNTDLNDNDVELTIVQGVNYNVPNPKEIDTYVRYEFPYPTDDPKKDRTSTVYNTNNPNYNAVFVIPIQRNNRACQRIFKRHSIKFEVWSKGGFLRNDSLVGTVNVKLLPLETKCTIHDSFDLMDGRKSVGGKLEVKVRVRHPIQTKQMEQIQEKWLVID